jgi:hypothetical protein
LEQLKQGTVATNTGILRGTVAATMTLRLLQQQRPPGKKKEKQILRQHASMEAIEYLVAKKKEPDAEKELKKEKGAGRPLRFRKKA